MRVQRTHRSAFTLTEMMVATALILFLMAIISQTFGSASKTFNHLRVAGQMQERLRLSSGVMRKDLTLEHFDGPYVAGRSGPRLSDQRLDLAGWVPPERGYLEIQQLNPGVPVLFEPLAGPTLDGEGLSSSRSDTHRMRFTVKLPDLPASELFCASAPAGTPGNAFPLPGQNLYYSRWAEVAYFLAPHGDFTPATNAGPALPLYSLRRRIRLLAPQTVDIGVLPAAQAANFIATYPEMALIGVNAAPGQVLVRLMGPELVTNPANRIPFSPLLSMAVGGPSGDDVLLTDVISFEIKPAWGDNPSFNALRAGSSPPANGILANSDAPYDVLPQSVLSNGYFGQRVFDTFFRSPALDGIDDYWDRPLLGGTVTFLSLNTANPPVRINVRSIQIKIRVWDPKAEQARQATIMTEL